MQITWYLYRDLLIFLFIISFILFMRTGKPLPLQPLLTPRHWLDLSSAFDHRMDHKILLHKLDNWVGLIISNHILKVGSILFPWVSINMNLSPWYMEFLRGEFLHHCFNLYMLAQRDVSFYSSADEAQIYLLWVSYQWIRKHLIKFLQLCKTKQKIITFCNKKQSCCWRQKSD